MCLASFVGVGGPREPPNTCVSMGKLNILDHKNGQILKFSWFALDFFNFSFSDGFMMFLWSDSDSLTCFAAWGWSQIVLGSSYEGFMTGTRC